MRVAVVVTGGLHPSGQDQVVPSWLSLFSRLSTHHEIHAFVLRHLPEPSTYQLKGVTVHDLGRPSAPLGFRLWAQQRALERAMSSHTFDLVHGFWGDPAGVLATRMATRFSIPSIVTCDSGEFVGLSDINYGSQRTARGRSRITEAVRAATVVHVCTSAMADRARALGAEPVIVPLGVETLVAISSPPEGPPWRLLQVGSLSGVKNQAVLIEALAIAAPGVDLHLDLAGEDTLNGALQHKARDLGVADRVTFHGFVPHSSLGSLRARAHLYVQTSRHESAGVAVLEAAAAGIPVLGTCVGYVADWSPNAARAIDRVTPESLAKKINDLLKDAPARQQLAAASGGFARRCNADYTAAEFDRLYRETATRRSSTAS